MPYIHRTHFATNPLGPTPSRLHVVACSPFMEQGNRRVTNHPLEVTCRRCAPKVLRWMAHLDELAALRRLQARLMQQRENGREA